MLKFNELKIYKELSKVNGLKTDTAGEVSKSNKYPFKYWEALYRKDNNGNITVWACECDELNPNAVRVYHGRLDGNIIREYFNTNRISFEERESRYNAKRKTGYKYLYEVKDNVTLPTENELLNFLKTYLPNTRTTADGSTLAMLAKVFDNTNNKLFKKTSDYIGQWKINGLRCFIRAEETVDIFHKYHLKFQSREGTYWDSLAKLEEILLNIIPEELLELMVHEDYILDGELYYPGASVNEINHYVKDPTCIQNARLQYWCYDLAIENVSQRERLSILTNYLIDWRYEFKSKEEHLANTAPLVYLPPYMIANEQDATFRRNEFIDLGFEGLIMRNPTAEYQFGKRNSTMIKYKKSTDGKFQIIDIYPEGNKRSDLPLLLLKNDINDATFEVHIGGSFDYQRNILNNKDAYIGCYVYVEYGERSGVEAVPFHVKTVKLL